MYILGYRFEKTCGACPEQYDVFSGDVKVGYLRLRHGHFSVECPDCGGDVVFWASPQGDGLFEPEERAMYLLEAAKAIAAHQGEKQAVETRGGG